MSFALLPQRRLAAQLGNPHGRFGRFVARRLNASNKKLMTACVAALELPAGAAAVDVGFGGGLGLQLLLDAVGPTGTVSGVDRSETVVIAARHRYGGRVTLHHASMTGLPLDSASVDGAMSCNTIYFLDDDEVAKAFTELARVLRPAGRLGLGIGDPDAMAKHPLMAHGFRVRTLDQIEATANAAGLGLGGHTRSGTNRFSPHVLLFRKD